MRRIFLAVLLFAAAFNVASAAPYYTFDGKGGKHKDTGLEVVGKNASYGELINYSPGIKVYYCDTVGLEFVGPTGYDTFAGWCTDKNATVLVEYLSYAYPNYIINFDSADKSYYAKWTANTYTIKFDSNGGSGSMANLAMTYDVAKTLTQNAFTKAGYTFKGWALSKTGDVKYANKASVKNLTATKGGTVTLYAVWEGNTYEIRFHSNDGTETTRTQQAKYGVNGYLKVNEFSRTGYEFAGWALTSGGEAKYIDNSTYNNDFYKSGKGTDLYAVWESIVYYVKFDSNGGSGSMAPQQFRYDEKDTFLNLNEFFKEGYSFKNWKGENNIEYADGAKVKNLMTTPGTFKLSAQWTNNFYTVSFNANGGACDVPNSIVQFDKSYGELPSPTMSGYIFDGWHDAAVNGNKIDRDTKVSKAYDHTLYAQWTAIRYAVKFNANGGTGEMANMEIDYGVETNLANCGMSRVGYLFVGWNTLADGSGIFYGDGGAISNQLGDVTFYAQWSPITYYVEFDGNGADSGSMPIMTNTYDVVTNLPLNVFVRSGREFKRWKASGQEFSDGCAISNLVTENKASITLVASWGIEINDFSRALDNENIAFSGEGRIWTTTNDAAFVNGSCLRVPGGQSTMRLAAEIEGAGKLKFSWRVFAIERGELKGSSDSNVMFVCFTNGIQSTSIHWLGADNENAWRECEISLLNPTNTITWAFTPNLSANFALLDNVRWIPAGVIEEPTESDRPVISALTRGVDGKLSLKFIGDARFDYELRGTNTLRASEPWPLIDTIPGIDGEITFGGLINESEESMFYRVRVIPKVN